MLENETFEIAAGVNYQSLGGAEDGILLSMASGYLYRCNHSALEILDAVKEKPTYGDLLTKYAGRHGLEMSQARNDVSSLLNHLLEEQLIAKVA